MALSARSLIIAALFALIACHGEADNEGYSSVLRFDSTRVRVLTPSDSLFIPVEVARLPEQRSLGLMERRSLPDSAGMLFLYSADQPATSGFWMFRTRIPLDIAFLDSAGTVVAIRHMEPCTAQLAAGCPTYEPGAAYRAALEVNAGFLQRHGVVPGSRIVLPDLVAQ
jgi:uncharacterized membrane protein (UPF0127 family)